MCGRFTRKEKDRHLAEALKVAFPSDITPRYNIAPSQQVACVRSIPESKERECVELKWGLVPSWAKDVSIGNKMINARAETASEKPSFRKAFKHHRCVVLADGYYEWNREGKAKQPFYIQFKDQRMFAFAGLWERWEKGSDGPLETCALLTIEPNAVMEPIHHRMPVILQPRDYDTWLDPGIQDPTLLSSLLHPYPSEEMETFPVSPMVNNPRNDSADCVKAV